MAIRFNQCVIFITALLSGILIGYCTAVIAGALVFLDDQFHFAPWQEGVIVSSVLIGGFVGALLISGVAKKFGPKASMMITCVLFALGSIATSLVTDYWLLTLGRFTVGLAVGAMTMLAPLYIAETSADKWRGFFVSNVQLAITLGIFSAYLINYHYAPTANWQAMFLCAVFPASLLFLLLMFCYESPRWLLLQGRHLQAKDVFHQIHGKSWDVSSLPEKNIGSAGNDSRFNDLFKPMMLSATLLAASLFLFQNLSGIDALLYYAPHIFKLAGFTNSHAAFQITIALGLVNIVGTIASMLLVDNLGRRPLLLFGLGVMTASLLLFSSLQIISQSSVLISWLSAAMLFSFITAFAISMGPIPYLIMSELFPLHLRTLGMSIVSATAWGINALVTFIYPVITSAFGVSFFFTLSALFCLAALIISYQFCPETKGCSLEEIEQNLVQGKSIRHVGR